VDDESRPKLARSGCLRLAGRTTAQPGGTPQGWWAHRHGGWPRRRLHPLAKTNSLR
jgi:hypothetical protein